MPFQTSGRVVGTLLTTLLVSSCGTTSPRRPPVQLAPVQSSAITADDYASDAVVLSRIGKLRFRDPKDTSSGFVMRVDVRAQILTPAGRRHARVVVPVDSWSTLGDVKARSYAANGAAETVMKMPSNSVAYVQATEGGILYSDTRLAAFDVPGAEPGRIVEYTYTLTTRQVFSLPTWTFDGSLPVLLSRIEVDVPAAWELKWGYAQSGTVAAPPEPERRGATGYVWQEENLDAIEADQLGLPAAQVSKRLGFTIAKGPGQSFGQWSDIGQFYRSLTTGLAQAPQAALASLDSAGRQATEMAPSEIFEFVRDRIRYVAIEQGIGALKPHPANDVYDAQLGDCKDMTTLLVALYRHYGVEAYPVLIGTRSHGRFHPDVPSIGAFNHVIVGLPQDDGSITFADATAKNMPFGQIPWAIQGQDALVVDGNGSKLVQLPVAEVENNVSEVTWKIGDGRGSLEIVARGLPSHGWRHYAEGRASNELLRNAVSSMLSEFEEAKVEKASIVVTDEQVKITADLSAQWLEQPMSKMRAVPLGPFFSSTPEIRIPKERSTPVELHFPGRFTTRVVYQLPRGGRVDHVPTHKPVTLDVGDYALTSKTKGGTIELRQEFVRKLSRASAEALPQVRQLSELLNADSRDAIVIKGGR